MQTTILKEIIAFILGRKYYANIVATKGTAQMQLCSYIFPTREEARRHRDGLAATLSFQFVETVSFRSRRDYRPVKAGRT